MMHNRTQWRLSSTHHHLQEVLCNGSTLADSLVLCCTADAHLRSYDLTGNKCRHLSLNIKCILDELHVSIMRWRQSEGYVDFSLMHIPLNNVRCITWIPLLAPASCSLSSTATRTADATLLTAFSSFAINPNTVNCVKDVITREVAIKCNGIVS